MARRYLGVSNTEPIDIFELVQNIDHVSLVLYPMGKKISGMCVTTGKDTVIAVNSLMSIGRQNFAIAHELYYYFFRPKATSVSSEKIGGGSERENEADQFASFLLVPIGNEILPNKVEDITKKKLIEMEMRFKVSNQAMLYRLILDNIITSEQVEKFKNGIPAEAERLGYDTSLYCATPENRRYKTYGYYVKQTQEVIRRNLVSDGKYEQMLLEAFRPDIVYGNDEMEELND